MYSLVLMTALTSGSAAPDHWVRSSCHSCWGGSGCYCSGCDGCTGCHGCWGGYGYMNVHGNFCHGCWGGYGGCYGGCYGGYPGYSYYAPHTCNGCYGCYGGYSCYGVPLPYYGPVEITPPKDRGKIEETPLPREKKKEIHYENRARVVIDVPEDAKVYIDGKLMKTTSTHRTFQTPDLSPGQVYFYDLRVEIIRDGKVIADTQRVTLRPGEVTNTSFTALDRAGTATASRE
jgi:uncharacterized protein (TIGR03000 family)